MAGRSSFNSVQFYILGDEDIEKESHANITNKSTFADGVPVANGLHDAHLGTTELSWKCQTCGQGKLLCPGHDGSGKSNYPLQNAKFRKEILKWLKACCHTCGELISKKPLPASMPDSKRLTEFTKMTRTSNEKYRKCPSCDAIHPYVTRDPIKQSVIYREYYSGTNKNKAERKEIMHNHMIGNVLSKIPDHVVLQMGKKLNSHPKKLILRKCFKVPSTVIRPEIRKIGGNRSTMSDTTALLRSLFEINSQIPRDLPAQIDNDLHTKLVLADLTFFEMIQGSSPGTSSLKLVTNTNKTSHSIASRLPKKTGRLRGNLMGRRTTKMMRSVITGDKALRPDQVGVPKLIARNMVIEETSRPWNRDKCIALIKNGKEYPSVQKIWRIETGREASMENLGIDYIPQDGDILYRNPMNGDVMGFNREPALTFSSIAVLVIKIINGLTLRINSSICVGFNADFDGDEMNGLMIQNPESVAETRLTSSIHQWFVSYKNSEPLYGLFQDSIIGISEMTQSTVHKIDKYHAMSMINRTSTSHELVFDKTEYTGRELVSKFLPPINYRGRPKFYVPEFAAYIQYDPKDIDIIVNNGELVQGVLDKEAVGQGSEGGIFHIIYLERGPTEAVNCMYNLQQLVNGFLYFGGATISLKDIYLNRKARQQLKLETAKIIAASEEITKQLDEGKLVPPVGMTLPEYYEELQMSALDHGDEFIKPIMQNIDTRENWLYKFIFSGSKGAKSNLLAIFSSIGSIGIKGNRIKMALNGRTSINFRRFDRNPISRGYNPGNFTTGIAPITFPFSAMEARYELIEVALSTAQAGTMNRNAVKNLESIQVGNLRGSVKTNRLVQLLYGETALDPRKMQKIKFPTIKITENEFQTRYRTPLKSVDRKWQNAAVDKALDREFQTLDRDRRQYRDIFMRLESFSRGNFLMKDTIRMPINPDRIVTSVLALGKGTGVLDPVRAINLVDEYCSSLGYIWQNEFRRRAKSPIPQHIENATTFIKILIRSCLCTSNLIARGVDNTQLEVVLERLTFKITDALMEAGASIGIIAAQSISEPITQHLLDAKHRSGLKKSKTNTIDKFEELLGNKPTSKLHNPQMLLVPLEEYWYDKQKVMEIANHIEMLPTSRFIQDMDIYIEEYGKPEHPDMIGERKLIERSTVLLMGDKIPKDLINWCIRFTFRDEELILKSMKVKTIYTRLMEVFPYLYIVYTPQTNGSQIIMRIYIRNIAFKKGSDIGEMAIRDIATSIKNTIIRGIDGIKNTTVKSVAHTVINAEGGMEIKKMWVIETDGTNLDAVLENPYLDIYQCSTSSVEEVEKIYGIETARNKLLDELQVTLKEGAVYEHASIYADEMSFMGRMTSIQRSGLGKREADNVHLKATFGSPVQVYEAAAINSQEDMLHGMSAMMVMGTTPKFGTTYNDVSINEDAVRLLSKSADEIMDDL